MTSDDWRRLVCWMERHAAFCVASTAWLVLSFFAVGASIEPGWKGPGWSPAR